MDKPTLLYCVGATKAGTSWLHETLAGHRQVHLRSIKELHFFDGLENGKLASQAEPFRAQIAEMERRMASAEEPRRRHIAGRIADRRAWLDVLGQGGETAAYLDYLHHDRGDAAVVGDVTPAYGLLPVARLRQMAALAADTRFVYLLRDPVARLWSHVRMMAARRGDSERADPAKAANILRRTLDGKEGQIESRSDYMGALARLNAAVDPARLLVLFYENLFGGDALARLCAFLGIAPAEPDARRRVHEGAALAMTGDQRAAARAWLAPQYDHVAQLMGRLPDAWQVNAARV